MNAHRLGETGEILVTGTQDVEAARPLALACLVDDGFTDEEALDVLANLQPRVTSGVTVPASKDVRDWLGYTWWWREGDGGGRVKAVVFA